MSDKTPETDLREIWRSQPTESMEMKLGSQRLRQKAEDLQSKSRRELRNSLVVAVLIAAGSVYASIRTDFPLAARVSLAVAAAWVLIGQYFLHRAKSQAPPQEAGLRTTLDSCRRELERHMRFGRGVQLWLGGPLILAFGALIGALVVAIGGKGMLVKMAGPAAALLIAWALGIFVFRQAQERQFRRAIAELDQIAREQ